MRRGSPQLATRAKRNQTLRGRGFDSRNLGDPGWVDQKPKEPEDARESTEEQRRLQQQLEHQDEDPDGPGLQQSRSDTADESTR